MNILVIEEKREERLLIKRSLPGFCKVTTLSSIIEACAYLQSTDPDILIFSLNGSMRPEVTFELKLLLATARCPFLSIALVDYPSGESAFFDHGFDQIVPKAFSKQHLQEIIYNTHEIIYVTATVPKANQI